MRFKKGLIALLTLVLGISVFAPVAEAQSDYMEYLARFLNGEAVAKVRAVDDTDVAYVLNYVQTGTHTFAKVAVAADGNITLTSDATDGTTANTQLECPVSGDLGGVIDVSDGDCDTFGEVADIVNASTSWRMILVGALRTDTYDDTSILADAADFDAQSIEGDLLYWDTSTAFISSWVVSDLKDARHFYGNNTTLLKNPWDGKRAMVRYLAATSTFGSGASAFAIYSVLPNNQTGAETVTNLFATAGGATTVEGIPITLGMLGGILGRNNEKLLVRLENTLAMASTTLKVYGTEFASR